MNLVRTVLAAMILTLSWMTLPVAAETGEGLYHPKSLHHIELTLADDDWWQTLTEAKTSGALLLGSMRFEGREFSEVGIRFHGNSSFSPHRYSKKVPFWISLNHWHSGQRLDGRETLILKNNFLDPSLLREVLALDLLADYLPTPRANFVLVSINGESWGVYINIELPDREFVGRYFSDSSGPIHIGERAFAMCNLRKNSCQEVFPQVNAGADDACPQIVKVLALADGTDAQERHSRLPTLLDVDNTLRHLAAETMLGHTDGFPTHNYTLYLDPESGRFTTIPWDFNMAFRVAGMRLMPPHGILSDPVWFSRYRGYVRTMIERSLDSSRIERWIRDQHDLIAGAVEADDKKLYPFEGFIQNTSAPFGPPSAGMAVPGLKAVIEGRNGWLAESGIGAAPRIPLAFVEPSIEDVEGAISVCLRVRAQGKISVRRVVAHIETNHIVQEIEMRDDGSQGDRAKGDRVFTATLTLPRADAVFDYYFSVEAKGGDVNFLPYSGGFRPFRVAAGSSTGECRGRISPQANISHQ